MYYIVINGEIKKTEEQNFWDCDNGICVVKLSEWNESLGLREKSGIWHKADKIHFCKIETHTDYMFGTFRVPSKIKGCRDTTFAIYITEKRVVILDDDGEVQEAVKCLAAGPLRRNYSLKPFIYQ